MVLPLIAKGLSYIGFGTVFDWFTPEPTPNQDFNAMNFLMKFATYLIIGIIGIGGYFLWKKLGRL